MQTGAHPNTYNINKTQMLGALENAGVKDSSLAPTLAQLNATMHPKVRGRGGGWRR
jgi:hypothetical protein